METVISFIGKIFSILGDILKFGFNIVKFIISKCWKFILAILAAIVGIFITKKAMDKE